MKQIYLFAIAGAWLLIFTSCLQTANPGGKIWFFTHTTESIEKGDTCITPASFIDLEKDGSYTSDLGYFDYGTWIYDNNQLFLNSALRGKSTMPVSYLTDKEMQSGPPKGNFDNFESQAISFASAAENPFSKENNRWRIKATGKETPAQLKSRLLNHFKFWELYFNWALNDKIQYIDVRSTPTPVKIYGNGFSLKSFEELPAVWKSYFFDEEDCRMASEKIKVMFESNAIAWPHTENKFKMFMSAFQQMQQKLQ